MENANLKPSIAPKIVNFPKDESLNVTEWPSIDIMSLSLWVLEDLKKSGLNNDTIQEMKIFEPRNDEEVQKILGFSLWDKNSREQRKCYFIPYLQDKAWLQGEYGFCHAKLEKEIRNEQYGEKAKYFFPKSQGVYAYTLLSEISKISKIKIPIVVCEGEKKTAKVLQDSREEKIDITSVGIPGVGAYNVLFPQKTNWNSRDVYIALDSDYSQNPNVRLTKLALWFNLKQHNANAKILDWENKWKGIDDYLVANPGTLQILLQNAKNICPCEGIVLDDLIFQATKQIDLMLLEEIFQSYDLFKVYNLPRNKFSLVKNRFKRSLPQTEKSVWLNDSGKVVPGIVAEEYCQAQNENLIYTSESFWKFNGKYWRQTGDKEIAREIKNILGTDYGRKSIVEDILYLVMLSTYKQDMVLNSNKNLLCLQNCVLDLGSWNPLEHKKEYYQTGCISVEFDKNAKSEDWENFITSLGLSKESVERIQEFCGYCLTGETKIEKSLYLKGEGANGKSTFLEPLQALYGENASNLEMVELFDKFKIAEIQGKRVNFATDIDTNSVLDNRFKKLVSGEDVTAERKFKNPFKFKPFCKFMFSANDFLPTKDRSYGFYRRIDIIEFNKVFDEAMRDESLKERLKSPQNLQGILNWCLIGLERLKKNKWKLTFSPEMAKTLEEFKHATNPLKQFIDECCNIDPNAWIEKQCFRIKYVDWCKEKGYECLADNKLGREMKRLGITSTQIREIGGRPYIYKGILIK